MGVAETVAKLAGLYEANEHPTIHERVSRYWWGEWDEEIPGLLSLCGLVSPDPVARHLYEFGCAEEMAGERPVDAIASWCAGMAAECAMAVNSRRRPRIASYRVEWGRQAGKDGAALAMWGDNIRDVLPGVNKRGEQYGCRDEAYVRVRDYVQEAAAELIFQFRRDMEQAAAGRFDPDFRARWELKMGMDFPRH